MISRLSSKQPGTDTNSAAEPAGTECGSEKSVCAFIAKWYFRKLLRTCNGERMVPSKNYVWKTGGPHTEG